MKTSLLLAMLLLAAGGVYGVAATGMTFYWPRFLQGLGFMALWLALAWMNDRLRGDARWSNFLYLLCLMIAFSMVGFVWTYTGVALQSPLVDADLAAFDAWLGFDWPAFYSWVKDHSLISHILFLAYNSFLPQISLLTLWFCYRGQMRRAWEVTWLFWMSLFACDLISHIWQAAGAFAYFNMATDTPYVREYQALYHRTLMVIGATPVQGLIQFPSFHAAAAILFIYASRHLRLAGPLLAALNAAMLIAVLPYGGHFLADMLAGMLVAALAIFAVRNMA